MPKEKHQQNRPIGDQDLTGGRRMNDDQIVSGGVGPSGSDFTSTGKLGGLGNTSDGAGSTDNSERDDVDDHTMGGSGEIIDTNLSVTGVDPTDPENRR